jgi:hypothetical protein
VGSGAGTSGNAVNIENTDEGAVNTMSGKPGARVAFWQELPGSEPARTFSACAKRASLFFSQWSKALIR